MQDIATVKEVLFVFNSWTLMLHTPPPTITRAGIHITLLNESKEKIGEAIVKRLLSSRNPEIIPVEVESIIAPENFKEIRYISR